VNRIYNSILLIAFSHSCFVAALSFGSLSLSKFENYRLGANVVLGWEFRDSVRIKPAPRADASSARRRGWKLRGTAPPPAPTRPARRGQALAPPSPRRSLLTWPSAVPLNLCSPMSLPLHASAASCSTLACPMNPAPSSQLS
jgi:hypothetical protein